VPHLLALSVEGTVFRVRVLIFSYAVIPTGLAGSFFRSRRANAGQGVEGLWLDLNQSAIEVRAHPLLYVPHSRAPWLLTYN